MTILFSNTRPVKPARRVVARQPRPVFGQGIPTSDRRQPYTAADLAFWAANSPANLAAPDYDRMAEESAMQARYESGFVPC